MAQAKEVLFYLSADTLESLTFASQSTNGPPSRGFGAIPDSASNKGLNLP
jgi:hypothetical protein